MGNLFEKQFGFKKQNTSFKTEVVAGITTFVTMAYVLATVPNILAGAGFDRSTMLTAMIMMIFLTTVAMGLVTNRPFVLGPGLGSVGIVASMIANEGVEPSIAAGVIFLSGALFIFVSFFGLREAVVKAIPVSLKHAVSASIGLFIALIGAKSGGLIVASEARKSLTFGDLATPNVLMIVIGFSLILILRARNISGDLIISVLITTLIGIPLGVTKIPEAIFAMPTGFGNQFFQIDIISAFNFAYFPFLIALFIPDFFSTFGTVLGVGAKAGFLDKDGNLPGIDKCFQVDAVATSFGALFSVPTMTTYLESSAGVEAGGRTGLTAITTAVCFIFMLFLAPLALMIPAAATAPVLIFIGVSMLSGLRHVDYDDLTERIPAFLCVAFTIFGNNIANGICIAIPAYVILKLASGKGRELTKMMYILVLMCALYFYTII